MRLILKAGHATTDHDRCIHCQRHQARGDLSPDKAKEILHDGTVHGHPITDQQRKYFGAVASGAALQKVGTGEGSRGGHVVGHTRSAKPVYEGHRAVFTGATPNAGAPPTLGEGITGVVATAVADVRRLIREGHTREQAITKLRASSTLGPASWDRVRAAIGSAEASLQKAHVDKRGAGHMAEHRIGPISDCPSCTDGTIQKADPKVPGSRGGVGYRTRSGKWRYGQRGAGHAESGTSKQENATTPKTTETLVQDALRQLGLGSLELETDGALSEAIPRPLGQQLAARLRAQGMEADWAPDHEDPELVWVHISRNTPPKR